MKRFKGLLIVTILAVTVLVTVSSVNVKDNDFKIIKNLDIFCTLFKELNHFYVDNTDPEKLIQDGIEGMLKSLDPYTTFIPESEMDEFAFMTTGKYGGIGALIRTAGKYTIISEPYESFPAQKSGLMAGDTILEIDNKSIKGLNIKEVSDRLKGDPNTKVKIVVKRMGSVNDLTFQVMREQIKIDNVPYFGMVNDNVGYILLSNFTENASMEVQRAFESLKEKGARGIILDLRSNPGGLLIEAVRISNLFVNKGIEVVSTKGKVKNWDNIYKTEDKPVDNLIPLVVLVNRGSASASEIVAGSLQDLDRAIVIGQRTFGKGLVQTSRALSYNTRLKVTTAKYYIPSGRCIQAIDYSHRNEDGSVGAIPDSLINEFKTANGRKVYDGGGISPDIKLEMKTFKRITSTLYAKGLIYDYATIFRSKQPSIPEPEKFEITNEIYQDFSDYATSSKFEYETESDLALKQLIEKAKKEMYYNDAQSAFDNLVNELNHDLKSDLDLVRNEVSEILKDEIVVRYYYQKGQIRSGLINDEFIKNAVTILSEKETYDSILGIKNAELMVKD